MLDFMRPWAGQSCAKRRDRRDTRGKEEEGKYPCEVELCLHADVFAFLFILRAEDLQFFRLERTVAILETISGMD
jgi:hypothetical protein